MTRGLTHFLSFDNVDDFGSTTAEWGVRDIQEKSNYFSKFQILKHDGSLMPSRGWWCSMITADIYWNEDLNRNITVPRFISEFLTAHVGMARGPWRRVSTFSSSALRPLMYTARAAALDTRHTVAGQKPPPPEQNPLAS